jgi:hypothetical protein
MVDERVDVLELAFSCRGVSVLILCGDLFRKESGPVDRWLIRVTIIVRIAKNVERRPKDKARVSLVDTSKQS